MKNRLYTGGEIMTIQANMREIEKHLNRPIPGGLVSADDLKDHLLTTGEVLTICQNIESVTKNDRRHARVQTTGTASTLEMIIGFAVLALGLLAYFFDWF